MNFYFKWILLFVVSLVIRYFLFGIEADSIYGLMAMTGIIALYEYEVKNATGK